jgi:hypothetical protein
MVTAIKLFEVNQAIWAFLEFVRCQGIGKLFILRLSVMFGEEERERMD